MQILVPGSSLQLYHDKVVSVPHVDIRATACRPATLKHAIVLRTMRTRGLIVVVNDFFHVRKSKKSALLTRNHPVPRGGCSRTMDDDIPLFDDDTGEALNEAARELVLDALAADLSRPGGGDSASSVALGEVLSSIPQVVCAVGTYKYVQVQLTHPTVPGAQLLVVRSYDTCRYHAEVYQRLMRELRAAEATVLVVGRVVGGGRIRFDGDDSPTPRAAVWGYSKTFGKTAGCNEKTAAIITREVPRFENRVEWSDDGY